MREFEREAAVVRSWAVIAALIFGLLVPASSLRADTKPQTKAKELTADQPVWVPIRNRTDAIGSRSNAKQPSPAAQGRQPPGQRRGCPPTDKRC